MNAEEQSEKVSAKVFLLRKTLNNIAINHGFFPDDGVILAALADAHQTGYNQAVEDLKPSAELTEQEGTTDE